MSRVMVGWSLITRRACPFCRGRGERHNEGKQRGHGRRALGHVFMTKGFPLTVLSPWQNLHLSEATGKV